MRKALIILIVILAIVACSIYDENIDTKQMILSSVYDGNWKGEAIPEVYCEWSDGSEMIVTIKDGKIKGRATDEDNVIFKLSGQVNEVNEVYLNPVSSSIGVVDLILLFEVGLETHYRG